jgi:hypothetical protein
MQVTACCPSAVENRVQTEASERMVGRRGVGEELREREQTGQA